jgi:PAS domain S-box-containing protein
MAHTVLDSEVARAIAIGVSQAPGVMAMFDREMRYIAVNRRWHEEFRLGTQDLVGRCHYEVFPEIPERWREIHQRALAGEALSSDMDVFSRADGELMHLSWRVDPWREADGRVGGLLISGSHVSEAERRRVAYELVERELMLPFEQYLLGCVIADWSGVVLRANARALAINGCRKEEIVGQPFELRIHADDRAAMRQEFARLRTGGCEMIQGRHREPRPDGSVAWVEHVASMMQGRDGALPAMVMFLRDVTDHLELEQRLRESDRIASLGMLGASLGHDMSNVLLPLSAHVNVIEAVVRREYPDAAISGSLRSMRDGIGYLQNLADGMHFLAADDAPRGDSDASCEGTAFREWWGVVEPMLRTVLPAAVCFEVDAAEGMPLIGMGAHDLTRSVLNLLVNARDAVRQRFGPDGRGASVSIEVKPCLRGRRRAVRICVRDNGAGMPESVRARACEPFFTTKPSGRGTGLGLATVRRAVELAGGELTIESVVGKGTNVSLVIPARR